MQASSPCLKKRMIEKLIDNKNYDDDEKDYNDDNDGNSDGL